jgi:hypothetical protein
MSLIKCNDIQNASGGIPTVKSQQLIPTAWVNFNGTGTVAIRDSEGVSSITDNSTGTYSVNFTTTMADVNYSTVATAKAYSIVNGPMVDLAVVTSTYVRVRSFSQAAALYDTDIVCVQVMGGQA